MSHAAGKSTLALQSTLTHSSGARLHMFVNRAASCLWAYAVLALLFWHHACWCVVRRRVMLSCREQGASEQDMESLAMLMAHSVKEQRSTYDRRTKAQKVPRSTHHDYVFQCVNHYQWQQAVPHGYSTLCWSTSLHTGPHSYLLEERAASLPYSAIQGSECYIPCFSR